MLSTPIWEDLPCTTAAGHARRAALQAAASIPAPPAATVTYTSAGALLIVAQQASDVKGVVAQLAETLDCTVLLTGSRADALPGTSKVLAGRITGIDGYLGAFTVTVAGRDGDVNLAEAVALPKGRFDLILDLTDPPYLSRPIPPLGYYAPTGVPEALQRAIDELPGRVGEHHKPRYFHLAPELCAHARKGISGCKRCIDACPAQAIVSAGDHVEVNPYLCQGAGCCASVCPTGAIGYAFPPFAVTLERLRAALTAYGRVAGGPPVLLVHDAGEGRRQLERAATALPEIVVPSEVADVAAFGPDAWLAALAWGAAGVVLLTGGSTGHSALAPQVAWVQALLGGLGFDAGVLCRAVPELEGAMRDNPAVPIAPPAGFAPVGEKRTLFGLAIAHLRDHAPKPQVVISLPDGAPFGEVQVAEAKCTLCKACVYHCPGSALLAPDDPPELRFIEDRCVQCGLCSAICPEAAVELAPRYLTDPTERTRARVLKREEAFRCIRCGAPFSTRAAVAHLTAKLAGHPMFQGEALDRLKMCERCKVRE